MRSESDLRDDRSDGSMPPGTLLALTFKEKTQPRYDSIAAQTSREVDSLLSPEQRRMLDSIRAGRPRGGRTGAHLPSSH